MGEEEEEGVVSMMNEERRRTQWIPESIWCDVNDELVHGISILSIGQ